jgi:hypothetical protein
MSNNTGKNNAMGKHVYVKNASCYVTGFLVPREFIDGCTLSELEAILGFASGRLKGGAAFAQLTALPAIHEIEYYGDTRAPAHRFEEMRNKDYTRDEMSKAAYRYFRPNTELIKVIPVDNHNPYLADDQNWPPGHGAMQFRLKMGVTKLAYIVDVIMDYPGGRFR